MEHVLLSGNEAIARGAYEAGVMVCSAYPGTPSTEIFEELPKYQDALYCEWAPNEKVAAEVAYGASIAGVRSLCAMKHVGLNVAADPLYTASYIGTNGGMVCAVADDPGMHSSQNEQDSRHHAIASKVPMLEPSSSQECKDYAMLAFELSDLLQDLAVDSAPESLCYCTPRIDFDGGELEQRQQHKQRTSPTKQNLLERHLSILLCA